MKFYKITFYRIQMLRVHSTLLLLALLNLLTLPVYSNLKYTLMPLQLYGPDEDF